MTGRPEVKICSDLPTRGDVFEVSATLPGSLQIETSSKAGFCSVVLHQTVIDEVSLVTDYALGIVVEAQSVFPLSQHLAYAQFLPRGKCFDIRDYGPPRYTNHFGKRTLEIPATKPIEYAHADHNVEGIVRKL